MLDYVLRDMTHPDGGFFSAEVAFRDQRCSVLFVHTELSRSHLLQHLVHLCKGWRIQYERTCFQPNDVPSFQNAQDADSLDPKGQKKEGAFYLWWAFCLSCSQLLLSAADVMTA